MLNIKRSVLTAAMAALSFTVPAPAHSTVSPVAQAAAAMYVVTCMSFRGEIDDTEAAFQAIKFMRNEGLDPDVYINHPQVHRLVKTHFRLEGCRDVPL